jgi:hypothetical protein
MHSRLEKGFTLFRLRLLKPCMIAVILAWPAAGVSAFGAGDRQYWNLTQIQKTLSPSWKIFAAEELRWGGNATEFYFHRPEIGVVLRTSAVVSFSLCIKQLHTRESGEWKRARVPHANIQFYFNWHGLSVVNRNRMEYMDYESSQDFWRYRGLVFVYLPYRLPWLKSQPYVGDEAFRHFNGDGLKTNRIYAGLSTGIGTRIRLDTYYFLHQIRSTNRWSVQHVFGTSMTFLY